MDGVVRFYRVGDPYGCLSNFSPHPILVGALWPTSEHFFQASKFTDDVPRQKIQSTRSPMEAARIGRDRRWRLRPDWEIVKDEVMLEALRAKVLQHADVREVLLSTRDAELVEHTTNDHYWGDGGDGTGRNMLGTLWMQVRDELRGDAAK